MKQGQSLVISEGIGDLGHLQLHLSQLRHDPPFERADFVQVLLLEPLLGEKRPLWEEIGISYRLIHILWLRPPAFIVRAITPTASSDC